MWQELFSHRHPYLQLDLLKKKAIRCPDFRWRIINHTNHIYYGKEDETAEVCLDWLRILELKEAVEVMRLTRDDL